MCIRDSCKDIAGTLISFLRMAGFEAYPAMTMAGSRVESSPADHFNPVSYTHLRWRAHANLLFSNWLNYFVYQETPYNINDIA